MSIFHAADVKCPACGLEQEVQMVASVNAVRRPDLRAAILDRSFQSHTCESCGAMLRLPLHLTYVDMKRGLWIVAEPVDELGQWSAHTAEARALFDESFGDNAPAPARALAPGMRPRIVFGWPALREKIICNDMGLDDVTVELLKAALLRARPDTPMAFDQSLRLAGGDEQSLFLEVLDDQSEQHVAAAGVPRSLYDDIEGDDLAWATLRITLGREPFVDLKRFMVEGNPAEPTLV